MALLQSLRLWFLGITDTYGAHDKLICGRCGGQMGVIRRTPHDDYELQTFECEVCAHNIRRTADKYGRPHE